MTSYYIDKRAAFISFSGLDHAFGYVLGRGGFHIRPGTGQIWNLPL